MSTTAKQDCNEDLNILTDNIQLKMESNKILCNHCKRSKTNGIRCLGICVSDNDY